MLRFVLNFWPILLALIIFGLIWLTIRHTSSVITFEVAGRTYQAVAYLRSGEKALNYGEALRRFDSLNATANAEDARWILQHLADIPPHLGDDFYLVFPHWKARHNRTMVATLQRLEGRWIQSWIRPGVYVVTSNHNGGRVVRRVK